MSPRTRRSWCRRRARYNQATAGRVRYTSNKDNPQSCTARFGLCSGKPNIAMHVNSISFHMQLEYKPALTETMDICDEPAEATFLLLLRSDTPVHVLDCCTRSHLTRRCTFWLDLVHIPCGIVSDVQHECIYHHVTYSLAARSPLLRRHLGRMLGAAGAGIPRA